MRIIRTRDYNHMSEHAAAVIAAQLTLQPNSTLGLATLMMARAWGGWRNFTHGPFWPAALNST